MKLEFNLKQVQTLAITQELVLAIEILQLNNLELKDYIKKEAEENVALDLPDATVDDRLEKFIRNWKEASENRYNFPGEEREEYSYENFATKEECLGDHLLDQLPGLFLTEEEETVARYVLGNIDSNGYLTSSASDMAKEIRVSEDEIEEIIKGIQTFEPAGVGGRNLREVLLLQTDDKVEREIINSYLEEVSRNRIVEIGEAMNLPAKEVQSAVDRIKKLNPKPGASFPSCERTLYIVPDGEIKVEDGKVVVEIFDDGKENLNLNTYYLTLLQETKDQEVATYLKDRVKRAMFLVKAIEQRKETIKKVIHSIAKLQERFFLGGALVPMTLKDVAYDVEMSESTISRTTRGKYIIFENKTYELKDFFTQGLRGEGEDISSREVQDRIIEIIEGEDPKKPLSDQKISDMLKEEGVEISRRTVAKYRDEENIPATSKRRRF